MCEKMSAEELQDLLTPVTNLAEMTNFEEPESPKTANSSQSNLPFPGRSPPEWIRKPNGFSPERFCLVCGDHASGTHYGVQSCEGCRGFFKRSIRRQVTYPFCKAMGRCEVTKSNRARCPYCRFQKCIREGMNCQLVQHERRVVASPSDSASGSPHPSNGRVIYAGCSRNLISELLDLSDEKVRRNAERNYDLGEQAHLQGNFVPAVASASTSGSSSASTSNSPTPTSSEFDSLSSPGSDQEDSSATDAKVALLRKAIQQITDTLLAPEEVEEDGEEVFHEMFSQIDTNAIIPCDELTIFELPKASKPSDESNDKNEMDAKFIHEKSSQVFFLTIKWARALPAFQALPLEVQSHVLESTWSDLFILGCVQSQKDLPLYAVANNVLLQVQVQPGMSYSKMRAIDDQMAKLEFLIKSIQRLHLNRFQFASLRALILFSPDRYSKFGAKISKSIERVQQLVLQQLEQHMEIGTGDVEGYDQSDVGFKDILLLLPSVRPVDPRIVQEIFFCDALGSTEIERLIPLILQVPDYS